MCLCVIRERGRERDRERERERERERKRAAKLSVQSTLSDILAHMWTLPCFASTAPSPPHFLITVRNS